MTFLWKFFPGGLVVKNLPANEGNVDPIPGWERFLGKGNGNPLQHSCLENPIDRGDSPWTKEPGRLQTMGSQRVGHD